MKLTVDIDDSLAALLVMEGRKEVNAVAHEFNLRPAFEGKDDEYVMKILVGAMLKAEGKRYGYKGT